MFLHTEIARPSDLAGKPKTLMVTEMEALLPAHIPASENGLRELALRRRFALKEHLASRQLPAERRFLGRGQGDASRRQ